MASIPVLFNDGIEQMFQSLLWNEIEFNPVLFLFTNNITVENTNVLSDFTMAADAGAADVTLDYTTATITGPTSGVITATYPLITFLFAGTPSEAYYGYVVFDADSNTAWWGQNFDTPVNNTPYPQALLLQVAVSLGEV